MCIQMKFSVEQFFILKLGVSCKYSVRCLNNEKKNEKTKNKIRFSQTINVNKRFYSNKDSDIIGVVIAITCDQIESN